MALIRSQSIVSKINSFARSLKGMLGDADKVSNIDRSL